MLGADPCRRFARLASIAFLLVAAYTLAVKVPSGDFDDDWAHTVLHVATGVFAAYAGWFAARATPAVVLTWGLAVGYGALGVVGWFVDGLLMESTARVPVAAGDNVFHLVLGVSAVATILVARARADRVPATSTRSESRPA